jgi:glycyl-tRNA synthetase
MSDAYRLENAGDAENERTVLKFSPAIAPIKFAMMPLMKKPELEDVAWKVYQDLLKRYRGEYDVSGSIGKRYRRQDEIGTPYCITVDFDTLTDQSVTIRDRDSMKQERIAIDQINRYLFDRMNF